MIRKVVTGLAVCALMSSSAFAQTTSYREPDGTVVVHHDPDPVDHAVKDGTKGAAVGAAVGCVVTIVIGCAPGAAAGAAIGGGTGAAVGAANTPPPHTDVYPSDAARRHDGGS